MSRLCFGFCITKWTTNRARTLTSLPTASDACVNTWVCFYRSLKALSSKEVHLSPLHSDFSFERMACSAAQSQGILFISSGRRGGGGGLSRTERSAVQTAAFHPQQHIPVTHNSHQWNDNYEWLHNPIWMDSDREEWITLASIIENIMSISCNNKDVQYTQME